MKFQWWQRVTIGLVDIVVRPLTWLSRQDSLLDLGRVERILVYEHGNLGDIALLAPFLRALRTHFPAAHIAILGKAGVKPLVLGQGLADELIPIRVPWDEHLSRWRRYNPVSLLWPRMLLDLLRLRKRHFDLAFVSGRTDIRHNAIMWLTGARRRVGYGFAGGRFLLTDCVSLDLARPHVTDLSLQLLEHLGLSSTQDGKTLGISDEDKIFATKFLAEQGIQEDDLLVGVHAGARNPIRQWGEDHFLGVANWMAERFGAKIIWFTDPMQPGSRPTSRNIIPASFQLRHFLAVLSRCRLFVCNDSGPMHMAAGLGILVVAVYGPTEPSWFGPLGGNHQLVIREDVWCRPCGDRCIFREPYCLTLISPEQVMRAVEKAIEGIRTSTASVALIQVGETT